MIKRLCEGLLLMVLSIMMKQCGMVSSEKHTQFKTRALKSYPKKCPKLNILFLTKTAKEPYPLGPHLLIYILNDGRPSTQFYSALPKATPPSWYPLLSTCFPSRKIDQHNSTLRYCKVFGERGLFVWSPDCQTGLIPKIPTSVFSRIILPHALHGFQEGQVALGGCHKI